MMHTSCQPNIKCGYCGKVINASELEVKMFASTEEVVQAGVNPAFVSLANYSIPVFAFCPYCNNCIRMKGFT